MRKGGELEREGRERGGGGGGGGQGTTCRYKVHRLDHQPELIYVHALLLLRRAHQKH